MMVVPTFGPAPQARADALKLYLEFLDKILAKNGLQHPVMVAYLEQLVAVRRGNGTIVMNGMSRRPTEIPGMAFSFAKIS
jgi:hypothetical protein